MKFESDENGDDTKLYENYYVSTLSRFGIRFLIVIARRNIKGSSGYIESFDFESSKFLKYHDHDHC